MKISKILLILTFLILSVSLLSAQEVEVTDNLSLNDAIDFVIGGGATTLVLATDGGVYPTTPFVVTVPITIKAKAGLAVKPTIVVKGAGAEEFISVKDNLTIDGVVINGLDESAGVYDSLRYVFHVSSTEATGEPNLMPNLIVRNCTITNVYRYGDPEFSADGNILNITTGGRTGTMLFENNIFSNTGDEALRAINTHKSPLAIGGVFATSFVVRNCTFSNIRGSSIKIEGDGDSTNVDPQVVLENLTFDQCQRRVIWHRDMFGTVVRNILITNSIVGNDNFGGSQALITVQSLGTTVANVDTFNIQGIKTYNGKQDTVTLEYGAFVAETGTNTSAVRTATIDESTIYNFDPGYADAAAGNFTLSPSTPILSLGNDGLAIGDRNWATMPTSTEVEVTDNLSLNDAIDFVIGGGATTLVLATDGGVYPTTPFVVTVPITIKAKAGLAVKPTIVVKGAGAEEFISVKDNLTIDGVVINGLDESAGVYDSLRYVFHVSSTEATGEPNLMPNLIVRNCTITNVYRYGDPEFSADGNILNITTGGRTGTMLFENNIFSNTGDEALRAINTHKSPLAIGGVFATSFVVRNCTFSNIRGSSIKIEGDGDSTNVDPQVVLENLTFDQCQRRVIWHRDMFGTVVRNILITNSIVGNDNFGGSQALITVQSLGTTVANVDTFNIQGIKTYNGKQDTVTLEYGAFVAETGTNTSAVRTATIDESTIYNFDPGYADAAAGNFTLSSSTPILTLGNDGLAIGDRNWSGQLGPVSVESDLSSVPDNFTLSQNYPNPFNPTTQIQFSIPASGNYTLKVYNLLGQEVASLINGQLAAGTHTVSFDASRLASGIYFYNFNGNNFNQTKKMILLK